MTAKERQTELDIMTLAVTYLSGEVLPHVKIPELATKGFKHAIEAAKALSDSNLSVLILDNEFLSSMVNEEPAKSYHYGYLKGLVFVEERYYE
jgi:hypothetical protein